MLRPIFFVSRTSAGTAFFLLALLPGLSSGAERGASAPMTMYFDDSQLVEVATRAPKPMSQVAENVSLVTAAEIEALRAHTVADVLRYVAGMFIMSTTRDPGGPSSLHVHNSDYEHVTVLLDGMRWSFIDSEFNETNAIPVSIIERIEIIKGAASSTWGSSLGGVINIITKGTGKNLRPEGSLTAVYGEGNTQAYNGEVAGKIKKIGYYFHAGGLNSDGLVSEDFDRSRDFETFYGKLSADLPFASTLTASMGRFNPYYVQSSRNFWGERFYTEEDDQFQILSLDGAPGENSNYHLSYQNFAREYRHPWMSREASLRSVEGYFNWKNASNSLVVGGEHHRNYYEDKGVPDRIFDEFWAFFINDPINFGKWALTPGLRYDQNLNADDMLSPSLGLTWQLSSNNLLRLGVARGFRRPPSALLTYSTTLQPSKAWSYQVGLENTSLPFLRMKSTLFQNREKDSWSWDSSVPTHFWGAYVNTGKTTHTGLELEAETAKWNNLSAALNYTYTYTDYYDSMTDWYGNRFENDDQQVANLLLKYDSDLYSGRLGAHYFWAEQRRNAITHKYDTIIWDMTMSRHFRFQEIGYDLFFSVNNLFSGSQYTDYDFQTAGRWMKAGVTVRF